MFQLKLADFGLARSTDAVLLSAPTIDEQIASISMPSSGADSYGGPLALSEIGIRPMNERDECAIKYTTNVG